MSRRVIETIASHALGKRPRAERSGGRPAIAVISTARQPLIGRHEVAGTRRTRQVVRAAPLLEGGMRNAAPSPFCGSALDPEFFKPEMPRPAPAIVLAGCYHDLPVTRAVAGVVPKVPGRALDVELALATAGSIRTDVGPGEQRPRNRPCDYARKPQGGPLGITRPAVESPVGRIKQTPCTP